MIIGILGSPACAHYLSQKLLSYPNVEKIYHIGANSSINQTDRYIPLLKLDQNKILNLLTSVKFDLLIPTQLLYQHWVEFQNTVLENSIPTLMPSEFCANLEWSKAAGKKLLNSIDIPTPSYQLISRNKLLSIFNKIKRPFVVKFEADWRAGAQTLIVTDESYESVFSYIKNEGKNRFMVKEYGDWTRQEFVVEEFIKGAREYSYHAVCGYDSWSYLGSARDYKKRFENDQGPNTTGMGAYGTVEPNPKVHQYVEKILKKLKDLGHPYKGILYLGIIENANGDPLVLEINTRFGDPEIISMIPSIETNLLDLFFKAATNGKLEDVKFNSKKTVAIRIVHEDLFRPSFEMDDPVPRFAEPPDGITISKNMSNNCVLHAVVSCTDFTESNASDRLYKYLSECDMGKFVYRTDIGYLK